MPDYSAGGGVEAGDEVILVSVTAVFSGVAHGVESVVDDGEGGEAGADFCLPEGGDFGVGGVGEPVGFGGDAVALGSAPLGPIVGGGGLGEGGMVYAER